MNRLLILSVLVVLASSASLSKKKDNVIVTLLTESLCPGCIDFITTQLYPVWQQYESKVIVDFIPYGNAQQTCSGGHWVFTCQHGDEECLGNKLEACATYIECGGKQTKDCDQPALEKVMQYINCLELGQDPKTAHKKCAKKAGLPAAKVLKCANGKQGEYLENLYGNLTGPFDHQYTPWIVINGKHTEKLQNQAQTDLKKLLCGKYISCSYDTPNQ